MNADPSDVSSTRCRLTARTLGLLCSLVIVLATVLVRAEASDKPPTSLLSEVVRNQAAQLAALESDAGAMGLFTAAVGPSLDLRDAAATLGAKGIPVKLAKELELDELARSARTLMTALAIWQAAETIGQAVNAAPPVEPPSLSPSRQEWFKTGGAETSLAAVLTGMSAISRPESTDQARQILRAELALAAARLAFEANQQAVAAWWDLYGWKDRLRQARGRARLCGSWHWVIHNHQNHQEQKTVVAFPPAGADKPSPSFPAEIVILGDSVYLRWETGGRVQEDSLLFVKEGTRIEGSFVNNAGGWGSITAKRIGGCQP